MHGVRVCKILLLAGSLLGASLTLAAAADQDRSRQPAGARSQPAAKTPSVVTPRRTRHVRRAPVRMPPPNGWQVYWPYRPYEQVAIRWPLLFVGVGY